MQKRRRIIAIVLTAALSGTMLPANSLTMYAADKLSPAKSIRADVDKTKFTHKEWTAKSGTGSEIYGRKRIHDERIPERRGRRMEDCSIA